LKTQASKKPDFSEPYARLLEAALIEYVEKYGLSEQARKALSFASERSVGDRSN
jgi:hypothetical protein